MQKALVIFGWPASSFRSGKKRKRKWFHCVALMPMRSGGRASLGAASVRGGGGRGGVGGWGGWSPARLLHIPRPFLLGDNQEHGVLVPGQSTLTDADSLTLTSNKASGAWSHYGEAIRLGAALQWMTFMSINHAGRPMGSERQVFTCHVVGLILYAGMFLQQSTLALALEGV